MQLRRPATLAAALFSASALCLLFTLLFPVRLQADSDPPCGSKAYLDSLPVPKPKDPKIKRVVQLINCSDQVLLGAATASHTATTAGWPVFPRSGTWVMQKYVAGSTDNVLTIDIPTQWYGQHVKGETSNIWARTGCRYDPITNRAQCETGDCSGQYDCSSANLGPPAGTTLSEWTFHQPYGPNNDYYLDSPDISAVNGANLTIDVYPRNALTRNPTDAKDWHWLAYNWPLTVHGEDLRETGRCETASGGDSFRLLRSDTLTYPGGMQNYPLLGYVIVDGNGDPTMPKGNNVLACFSNCGVNEFPKAPLSGCDLQNDQNCYTWTTFCAGNSSIKYAKACQTGIGDGTQCNTDSDCLKCNPGDPNLYIACFKNAGPNQLGECQLRAFYQGSVSQCNNRMGQQFAAPADLIACNNTYGSLNPLDPGGMNRYDYQDQPPNKNCSDVTFGSPPKAVACVGDDTLHAVLHGAYTWPNDPEVFNNTSGIGVDDYAVYQIVFSPEGEGNAPITPAQPIPLCASLPPNYMPSENQQSCSGSIANHFAEFGVALVRNDGPPMQKWHSTGHDWPCSGGSQRASEDNGVACFWNPPPTDHCTMTDGACNCTPPLTDPQNVTNSACGRADLVNADTPLVSGSITPNSGDPLFLEISIPCTTFNPAGTCMNPVSLPNPPSGCVPSQGMGSWTVLAKQFINGNQGLIAWYTGTSNTSVACNVTVTTATSNPAELKIFDVPKFNGMMDTMSTASGTYTIGAAPDVSAGVAMPASSNDLQLGALLQVNLTPTPITYWQNWLNNIPGSGAYPECAPNCPKEDGTDYLSGHGPYSGNSDVGHHLIGSGMQTKPQYFYRSADIVVPDPKKHVLGSYFAWAGLAIYVELAP
jgi:hypothetical protein